MRLFIGIDLSPPVRERLAELTRDLARVGRGVNWVAAENLHLTLKFLGHVDEENIAGIALVLEDIAGRYSTFDLDIVGAGAFPDARQPRVIWVGGWDRSGTLAKLQTEVEDTLEILGFPREERPFAAHFTLGRVKNRAPNPRLTEALEKAAGKAFGLTRVEEIQLIESQLQPHGALYTRVGSWKLGG